MKKLRRIGVVLLLVFLFSSCVKEVSYYEEEMHEGAFVMKNHSPQRVSDRMILEIVEISDFRCPIGVVCASPGEVGLSFKAYINGEFVDLQIAYEELWANSSITFEGHLITILEVNPMLYDGEEPISADDYSIKLVVDKL